jgi:hypothetical protein
MPRYVILEHDHPTLHWDLMLEEGEKLRTWRLSRAPVAGVPIAATCIDYHRRMYLYYEGPVSGGRGTVRRWDAGNYSLLKAGERRLSLELQGDRCKGRAALEMQDGPNWIFNLSSASDP